MKDPRGSGRNGCNFSPRLPSAIYCRYGIYRFNNIYLKEMLAAVKHIRSQVIHEIKLFHKDASQS